MADLLDMDAEVGNDSEEEEFDEETGEPIPGANGSKRRVDDDSSEEEEDDDEEEARKIREGFIVDEDEEDDDDETRAQKKERRKKRRREEREEEEVLDEEDFELIGQTHPEYDARKAEQVCVTAEQHSRLTDSRAVQVQASKARPQGR